MKSVSIKSFITAIERLPADPPVESDAWYLTQKEHWLGWLSQYHGPGYYGRDVSKHRDARFAYNHIVEWRMLEWLIRAAGADESTNKAVQAAAKHGTTLQAKAGAIRREVPWEKVAELLWSATARAPSTRATKVAPRKVARGR